MDVPTLRRFSGSTTSYGSEILSDEKCDLPYSQCGIDTASYTGYGYGSDYYYDYSTTFAPSTNLNLPHGDPVLEMAIANAAANAHTSPKMREHLEELQRQRIRLANAHRARNARTSTYFRRPPTSDNTVMGPSASQHSASPARRPLPLRTGSTVKNAAASPSGKKSERTRLPPLDTQDTAEDAFALQDMLNERLRNEVTNLRREVTRIQAEVLPPGQTGVVPPPSYSNGSSTGRTRRN